MFHVAENKDTSCEQKENLGDTQHKTHYYENKYLFVSSFKLNIHTDFIQDIAGNILKRHGKTPREKRYLCGDSKPSSVLAIGMFGLAMAGYGRKQNYCQIGQKCGLSFKSM